MTGPSRPSRLQLGLLIVITLLALAGCGENAVAVDYDNQLDRQLSEIAAQGQTAELGDLVAGDWDTAKVFAMDAWSKTGLEKEVGQELDMPDYFMSKGSIVFLLRDGRIARGIALNMYFDPGSYKRTVRVEGDSATKRVRLAP